MTPQVGINAFIGLTLMLAVVVAYCLLARRFRFLWHPLAIVAAVTTVSVAVAVSGELLSHDGGAGVPGMLRRSAIGGFGWGVMIAVIVWTGRRVLVSRPK
jgi:hypothetical protein